MAQTKITDIIVPDVFNPYVVERTTELTNFYMGGIVSNDAQLDALAQAGGTLINMPFWSDLTGESETLSDADNWALTPSKITASQDKAHLLAQGKMWAVNDLAKALSGDDPMMRVGDLVADFWARDMQRFMGSILKGVMADNAANNGGDMQINVAGATNADVTANTKFNADVFIEAQATFGDASTGLSGIAMHSRVYHNLKKVDAISFEKESMGDLEIETYRGLRIIVNDQLPFTAATGAGAIDAAAQYTSYLFANGAFGYGEGAAPVPSETDRDSAAGIDYLITRRHYLLHPRGVKFNAASVAGSFPTRAELESAANWTRVYDRKHVRIASIVTNG